MLVAGGTTLSAFWIIVLNSWMHTPAGFEMLPNQNGVLQAHVTNWWAVIFNPSMPYRLSHMLVASALTAAFLIGGISSYRWLRGDHAPSVAKALKTAVVMGALLMPLQIFLGHEHGLNTKIYQPAKLAAMEGAWTTKSGAPLVLFGLPDEMERRNHYEIKIPYLASLIVTHSLEGEIRGLNDFEVHPPVAPVFWAFRIMVGLGMAMWLISWVAAFYVLRGRTLPTYLLIGMTAMTFAGNIATVAGWYVTEIGRQPWLVQGVLTTTEALGPVAGGVVLMSLIAYLAIYAFLTTAYVYTLFFMARKAGDRDDRDPETLKQHSAERHNVPLPV
jgi:cytochrome d ubiquinol oxidase subunit I